MLALALAGALVSTTARADEKQLCSAAAESAQTHRTEGKLMQAREELVRCAQQSCPKVVREPCAGWLDELDAELPSIVLRAVDEKGADLIDVRVEAGAQVLATRLDGKAITLDPAALTLKISATGFISKDVPLVVARGEQARVVQIVLSRVGGDTPAAEPRSVPVGGWVLLGIGLGSLVAFGVLEGVAQAEYADLEDGCGVGFRCAEEATESTRDKFTAAAVTLGVGLAAAVAGGTWLIVDAATAPAAPKSARIWLRASPLGVELFGRF
jgi:hypothetical protein